MAVSMKLKKSVVDAILAVLDKDALSLTKNMDITGYHIQATGTTVLVFRYGGHKVSCTFSKNSISFNGSIHEPLLVKTILHGKITELYTKAEGEFAKKQKEEAVKGIPFISPEEAIKEPAVALREATHLYQPVNGTTDGSVYFTVGISDWVNVAVRWKEENFSLRIEPVNFNKVTKKLKSALVRMGVAPASEKHWSMHLNVNDEVTARMIVGSVMSGMGVTWKTPLPDISVLEGKGA